MRSKSGRHRPSCTTLHTLCCSSSSSSRVTWIKDGQQHVRIHPLYANWLWSPFSFLDVTAYHLLLYPTSSPTSFT
jgi:hypothetical protein